MARTPQNKTDEAPQNDPSLDLVTEAQENAPGSPPAALDKNGPANDIPAPGEAVAGEKKVQVRTTGDFLVFDPYTADCVGSDGGEMRLTSFVKEKLEAKELEEF